MRFGRAICVVAERCQTCFSAVFLNFVAPVGAADNLSEIGIIGIIGKQSGRAALDSGKEKIEGSRAEHCETTTVRERKSRHTAAVVRK